MNRTNKNAAMIAFIPHSKESVRRPRSRFVSIAALGLTFILAVAPGSKFSLAGETGNWIELFNGNDLAGWTASESPESFSVRDGTIVARACGAPIPGQAPHAKCHLFYVGPDGHASFSNFEFQADVKCERHANCGVYFHTEFVEKAWPQKGFEIQINNNSSDSKKTGSLYAVANISESPARDNEWFHLHVVVRGKQVVVRIDGKTVVDWTEPDGFVSRNPPWWAERKLSGGTFALQAHDAQSTVCFKNIRVKPLGK